MMALIRRRETAERPVFLLSGFGFGLFGFSWSMRHGRSVA